MSQQTLFFPPEGDASKSWVPPTLPSLDGIDDIVFDTETSSLDWWDGEDIFVGASFSLPDGRSFYTPVRHRGGGNMPEENVRRFMKQELKGKRITCAHAKFDLQVARNFGVDLEEQGNTMSDVQHYAALLDDHRKEFSLEKLSQDILGKGKVKGLDKTKMAEYHAGDVAPYACTDVDLTRELKDLMWKQMDDQDLQRVRALEDKVIYPVAEMERNASPLDVELLKQWNHDCEQAYLKCLWRVHRETGVKVNPKSSDTIEELLFHLNIDVQELTDTGKAAIGVDDLRKYDHPVMGEIVRAAQLKSLWTKYLIPYVTLLTGDGRIRYHLHQLRSDEGGTVSGRFSSSGGKKKAKWGVNIQQVFNPARQKEKMGGDDYIIRSLFVPREGTWLSADAAQIEFRLVSHYAQPAEVLAAYEKDPNVSFHKVVWNMVREITDISYKALKDLNFAKVYGAGWKKCTDMMGLLKEAFNEEAIKEAYALGKKFVNAYDQRFPEIKTILAVTKSVAETRGFVRTLLGRRANFPRGFKSYSALNKIVQGGAGDLMKEKLVELHEARKTTGFVMRSTVHDEVNGDCPDEECARMVKEILDRQTHPELRVADSLGRGNWC